MPFNADETSTFASVNLNVEYKGQKKSYAVTFDSYVSTIIKQAASDFGITEAELRKCELRIDDALIIRAARLHDIGQVVPGCTINIIPKK